MPDELAAALDDIRERVRAQEALVASMAVATVSLPEFNAGQDRLAQCVPRLLAALDAVLAEHQMQPGMFPPECRVCATGDNDFGDLIAEIWPCTTVQAIAAALEAVAEPDPTAVSFINWDGLAEIGRRLAEAFNEMARAAAEALAPMGKMAQALAHAHDAA